MVDSYKREWKKLYKHPFIPWIIIFFVLLIVYAYVSVGLQFQKSLALFLENSSFSEQETRNFIANSELTNLSARLYIINPSMVITYSMATLNSLGPLGLSFIGALLFGIEYRYLRVSEMKKPDYLLGKLFSMLTFILFLIVICILTGYLMSAITPYIFNLPMDLVNPEESLQFSFSLLQVIGTIVSLLLWGVFAACIAVVTKSLLTGITVGFIYPIIEVAFLHSWSISKIFPLFIQKSMLPILFEKAAYGGTVSFYDMPDLYTLNQSILLSLLYIVLFVTIMFIVLKKQRVPLP